MKRTNQQLFDRVCIHFAEQKVSCVGQNNFCMYKNDFGLKCAIGGLLDDIDLNTISLIGLNEGADVRLLYKAFPSLSIFNGERDNIDLLSALQEAHDCNSGINVLQFKLMTIAKNFKLDKSKYKYITKWNDGCYDSRFPFN